MTMHTRAVAVAEVGVGHLQGMEIGLDAELSIKPGGPSGAVTLDAGSTSAIVGSLFVRTGPQAHHIDTVTPARWSAR